MFGLWIVHSYDEALQALADSEAKRETADKELNIVSTVVDKNGCDLATCIYVYLHDIVGQGPDELHVARARLFASQAEQSQHWFKSG